MNKKLSLLLNKRFFVDFINKIQDLSNINNIVKIKIDNDRLLMYSLKANDNAVLALKSFLLKTSNYIDDYNGLKLDFVIVNAPKLIKGLKFFDIDTQIKMDIICRKKDDDDAMYIRSAQFSNGKLKISSIGGEEDMIHDLNPDHIESRTNIENSNYGFSINRNDFNDIKKLSNIDTEDKILSIEITDGEVIACEPTKWELKIGNTNNDVNSKIVFNKKYLSNINSDVDDINFFMFETFILVKDNISNLMLSFEQDFSEDD